jgi:putative hydrolase
VQDRLVALATEYVSGYALDPDAIEGALGDLDPSDPETLQNIARDPRHLLEAMQTDAQRSVLPRLQNLIAVLEGYADAILEQVGEPLVPSFGRIHEAMQRHRLERGAAERTVELLLGLEIGREHYEQGQAFCAGVVERAGIEGLNRLFEREEHVPTPAEIEAPGLWLARIDLPE